MKTINGVKVNRKDDKVVRLDFGDNDRWATFRHRKTQLMLNDLADWADRHLDADSLGDAIRASDTIEEAVSSLNVMLRAGAKLWNMYNVGNLLLQFEVIQ